VSVTDRTYQLAFHHMWVIVLTAILVHGLMLLNEGLYTDSWIYFLGRTSNHWDAVYGAYRNSSQPGSGLLFWIIGYFPDMIFAFRLLNFLAIIGSSLLIYQISYHSGYVTRLESLVIALVSLVYPAMQAMFYIGHVALIWNFFFFLAVALAMRSKVETGNRGLYYRVASLIMLALSFNLNALLVFNYGFLLFLLIYMQRGRHYTPKQIFTRFLPDHLDYVLLPILIRVITVRLFPQAGIYASGGGYNTVQLDVDLVLRIYKTFISKAIFSQFEQSFELIRDVPLLIGLSVGVVVLTLMLLRQRNLPVFDWRGNSFAIGGFGFILLMLGIFPYAAAGKVPAVSGTDSRHAMLIALPMALILIGAMRLLFFRGENYLRSRVGIAVIVIFMTAFSYSYVKSYLDFQARWVVDRSIMLNLGEIEKAQENTTIIFNDVFWLNEQLTANDDSYQYWTHLRRDWDGMLEMLWGGRKYVGRNLGTFIDSVDLGFPPKTYDFSQDLSTIHYYYELPLFNFQTGACQAAVDIRRGENADTNFKMSMRYLFNRFFHSDDYQNAYLRDVTKLELIPLNAFDDRKCLRREPFNGQIFNPRTDTINPLGTYPDMVLFDYFNDHLSVDSPTRNVIETMAYETNLLLTSNQQTSLNLWRQTKLPGYLKEIEFEYLFFDTQWLIEASQEEYDKMVNPAYYELVREWSHPLRASTFRLYRVVGDEKL